MAKLQFIVYCLTIAILSLGCQAAQENELAPILYLNWDENGRIQLYQIGIEAIAPTKLTESRSDVLNYAPAPDGRRIGYSTGDRLWLIEGNGRSPQLLLVCTPAQCDQIVWHPDSQRLLYERTEPNAPTTLWWLDSETGETAPLRRDTTSPSLTARFSSDGEWVSYVISPEEGIEFYNFADGRHFQLPSNLGTPAIWHPFEPIFLYRNQQLITIHGGDDDDHQGHSHDFIYSRPLLQANTADEGQSATILSEIEVTDDASPAWSPDGQWIVFGRKLLGVENGRQLWLIRAEGREARALTHEPLIHHGVPGWSRDGRYILFQRFDTSAPTINPGVWILEPTSGVMTEIAASGFQPVWRPKSP